LRVKAVSGPVENIVGRDRDQSGTDAFTFNSEIPGTQSIRGDVAVTFLFRTVDVCVGGAVDDPVRTAGFQDPANGVAVADVELRSIEADDLITRRCELPRSLAA
jgi:hypothetical protein